MAEEDFPEWLKSLEKKFCNLSSARQTETLNQLIATCGSDQLWLLQQRLPELLYRDFVRWLDLLFMEIIQTLIVENSSLLLLLYKENGSFLSLACCQSSIISVLKLAAPGADRENLVFPPGDISSSLLSGWNILPYFGILCSQVGIFCLNIYHTNRIGVIIVEMRKHRIE